MKKMLLTTIFTLALAQSAFARDGEGGGRGGNHPEDGANRTVTCKNKKTGEVVLQFKAIAGGGQASTQDFDLSVKMRTIDIDDIGEVSLLDKRSNDLVVAKRLEELLKVTLTSNGSTNPIVSQSPTQRGFAQLKVIDPASKDSATVASNSRRGIKNMDILLATDESPADSLNIYCESLR